MVLEFTVGINVAGKRESVTVAAVPTELQAAAGGDVKAVREWTERFATLAGPWAPVQDSLQVGQDNRVD